METLFGMFPFLQKLFADGGYQGPQFANTLAKILPSLEVAIVKRPDAAIGFKIVRKRWIVERTWAWLNQYRRLSKDSEVLPTSSEAMIYIAMIRLMLRRLAPG